MDYAQSLGDEAFERLVHRLQTQGNDERGLLTQEVKALGAQSVLDCGCGVCTQADWLWTSGELSFYAGMDVSERMLHRARELRTDVAVSRGDVSRLPVASESFDAVIIRHVIEHLTGAYHDVIAEALRVARKGVVVDFFHVPLPLISDDISVHNPLGFANTWFSKKRWEKFLDSYNLKEWSFRYCRGTSGQIAAIYTLNK